MVQFFKWLVKVVLVVWILIIVITVIGCYTTPEVKEEPSIEVRDKTKEKTVDISFFKWIRSDKCEGVEVTGQGRQDLTGRVRVVESSGTALAAVE